MSQNEFILPYGRQSIDQDDIDAVSKVLRSDFLTTGPAVQEFEASLAKICGAKYAISVSSGTAALHIAYAAAGLGPGDEIITSPLTFAATANAALMLGARVRFCDIDPNTLNIDAKEVVKKINEKTKLIAPVDFAGLPAFTDELGEIATENNIAIVEDAAHSIGARYQGRPVGSLADMTTFSFHPVKTITTGEGGAVTTNSPELYEKLCHLRNHYMLRNPKDLREENPPPWHYEIPELGYNYRLTDIQAALGISQLGKLERFLEQRRKIAAHYLEELGKDSRLIMPPYQNIDEHGWHLFVLRLKDPAFRRPLIEELHSKGILAQVHYIPVNAQPLYTSMGYSPGDTPIARETSAQSLSIPCYPALEPQQITFVTETIFQCLDAIGYKN